MLREKSVVNTGILKHGGEIKIWMWLCVERESELRIWKESELGK